MKNQRIFAHVLAFITAAGLFCAPASMRATVLFSDNFNINSSALWTINYAPSITNAAQQSAEFAYDYSGFGIPAAPGSSDTLGLRLRSNIPGSAAAPVTTRPAGLVSGLSLSPTAQNFGSSYHLSFYAWVNFNGAPNASGLADNANSEGGTHNTLFSIGTSGTTPLVVGNTAPAANSTIDGVAFATTGDGGIGNDYRVYPKSGTIVPTGSSVYAAGSTANTAAYYTALFPAVSAPAVQLTLSTAEYGSDAANTQAGQTQPGAFGFAWHKVDLYKNGNLATWTIDDATIANMDISSLGALGGNNIAIGDSDVNTTTTRHPSLLFTLVDNLIVTDQVPEPSVMALAGIGAALLLGNARRRRN